MQATHRTFESRNLRWTHRSQLRGGSIHGYLVVVKIVSTLFGVIAVKWGIIYLLLALLTAGVECLLDAEYYMPKRKPCSIFSPCSSASDLPFFTNIEIAQTPPFTSPWVPQSIRSSLHIPEQRIQRILRLARNESKTAPPKNVYENENKCIRAIWNRWPKL
jgi:hypothetical protein